MPIDLTLSLYYTSLALSAAAVVVFLWLMRDPREPDADDESETHKGHPER